MKPLKTPDKSGKNVSRMFDDISGDYDRMNHLLSFGIDKKWRRKLIAMLSEQPAANILDLACGTGDLAIAAAQALSGSQVSGVDLSEGMLAVARRKTAALNLEHSIRFMCADALSLPFDNNFFDAVTLAFGIRNFENTGQGLSEIRRVLKPGGVAYILEFSRPVKFPMTILYPAYLRFYVPLAGHIFTSKGNAYSYLFRTIKSFPSGKKMCGIIAGEGFSNVTVTLLSQGIATIYKAEKQHV